MPTVGIGTLSVGGYSETEIDWVGQFYLGQWLFEGPDGYWTGTVHGYFDEDAIGRATLLLTGHEAYEGLTSLLMGTTNDPACPMCFAYTGAIFEGAVPAMPEPVKPFVE